MEITNTITLNLNSSEVSGSIYAKQGDDDSRYIQITLMKDDSVYLPPQGTTATFRCRKPDGHAVYNPATINADGTVTAELTQQVLAVSGIVRADISLTGDVNKLISSASFLIWVAPTPSGSEVDSNSEFLELQRLIQEAKLLLQGGVSGGAGIGYMMSDNTIILDNAASGEYTVKFEDWSGALDGFEAISVPVTESEKEYRDMIPENCIPEGVKRLGVYDSEGAKMGVIRLLSGFAGKAMGAKLYSFGAVSDIHLQYNTGQEDFRKALTYLNEIEDVEFTCIAGDLTVNGTDEELAEYKSYVESYSADTPVYAITGNHDTLQSDIEARIQAYTGYPLYYSFTHGDDVFIMVGVKSDSQGNLFTTAELQWLYACLEENRNKRCFVFTHVRPQDGCGNAFGIYNYDIWGGTEAEVFESLLKHYPNVVFFHGHSHLKFYLQYGSDIANYDNLFGCHSIHIPSLAVPRDGDAAGASSRKEIYADSEGYVVDVYENGILLRGRDFVREKFLPIGLYCLNTQRKTVEAGTYTDPTGTIITQISTVPVTGVTLSGAEGSVSAGGKLTITASVVPENASNKTVYWSSSDRAVATVSGGVITGVSAGTAVITATTADGGYTATYTVNVSAENTTNLLPEAIGNDGLVLQNGSGEPLGYGDGYYLSGSAGNPFYNMTYCSTDTTHFITGFMPYTKAQAESGVPVYIKGVTIAFDAGHTRMCVYPGYDYAQYNPPLYFNAGEEFLKVEELGEQYYKITPGPEFSGNFADRFADYAYMRFSLPGTGAEAVITVGAPTG